MFLHRGEMVAIQIQGTCTEKLIKEDLIQCAHVTDEKAEVEKGYDNFTNNNLVTQIMQLNDSQL